MSDVCKTCYVQLCSVFNETAFQTHVFLASISANRKLMAPKENVAAPVKLNENHQTNFKLQKSKTEKEIVPIRC